MKRLRRVAWLVILIVDAGFVAWGMMAAAGAGSPARARWRSRS